MTARSIIHCRCQNERGWTRVLAVLLWDGRLEIRQEGKTSIVSGGHVLLSCNRCGFETEVALDSKLEAAVG